MNKSNKGENMSKFKLFLKKYGYYLLLFVCVAMLVTVITLSVVNSNLQQTINTEKPKPTSSPVVTPSPSPKPSDNGGTSKMTFDSPIKEYTLGTNYSEDEFVFSESKGQWEVHLGIDFLASEGTDVLACYDGEVTSVENDLLNGTVVKIKHNSDISTVYSSLDQTASVKVGDKVKKGDVIGKVSGSAYAELSVGPHLHFEVLKNGNLVNPNDYLEIANK